MVGSRRDVVVVGGGHNGLVAAAYLARDGLDVLVCERREVVGGAAVSERPFGPDYLVTPLSYVVSLLPADLVSDLQLARHGYHVFPQGPYFAPRADGSYLRLPDDPAAREKELAKFSAADAAAYPAYEARMREVGQVLGPMLREIPARLGSRRPADLARQGMLLRHLRKQVDAGTVVATAHPQVTFGILVDPSALPEPFLADIRRWQSRSGTVKINLALDRLPVFASHPGFDPQVHGGTIVLAESLDDIENAFQEVVIGRPSAKPFADICIPSVFDDSLAPAGHHVMSLFTQWVPYGYASAPDEAELAAYADRVIGRMETVAPGFTGSVLHQQVIGPRQMQEEYGLIGGNIFHGELTLGQMYHARPAAGYADLRTPVRGLYQAGSATHGGGGVTGIPGRNVVRQIRADRRAARWRRRSGSRP
jgi:phytoene dehydrogenase-like protein